MRTPPYIFSWLSRQFYSFFSPKDPPKEEAKQTADIAAIESKNLHIYWQACVLTLFAVFVTFLPDLAYAGKYDTRMGNVLCKVSSWITGNTGKGLATIAISIIGVGALLGKVSWGMSMIVGIGVAIIFGAGQLVSVMGVGQVGQISQNDPTNTDRNAMAVWTENGVELTKEGCGII